MDYTIISYATKDKKYLDSDIIKINIKEQVEKETQGKNNKESRIIRELEQMEKAISHIIERITFLEETLKPVLIKPQTSPASENRKEHKDHNPNVSPLSVHINNYRKKLELITVNINNLIGMVDF